MFWGSRSSLERCPGAGRSGNRCTNDRRMIAVAQDAQISDGALNGARTDVYTTATVALASVVAFAIGFDFHGPKHVAASLPLAVVLLPLWISVLRRYRLAALISALAVFAIAVGLLLAERS